MVGLAVVAVSSVDGHGGRMGGILDVVEEETGCQREGRRTSQGEAIRFMMLMISPSTQSQFGSVLLEKNIHAYLADSHAIGHFACTDRVQIQRKSDGLVDDQLTN